MGLKDLVKSSLGVLWRLRPGGRVPRIIYYHSVHPEADRSHRPEEFSRQLAMLAQQGYRGILARDIPRNLTEDPDGKWVAITFDDGYEDNYTHAMPILLERGFPATFYTVAGMVADQPRSSDEGNMLYGGLRMLSRSMLREMVEAGMEIGSHSLTHELQTRVVHERGYEALVSELKQSRDILEQATGGPVISFAYPNGQLGARSADTGRALDEAGFQTGATTLWGGLSANVDLLDLPRCEAEDTDRTADLAGKMAGHQDWRGWWCRHTDRSQLWLEEQEQNRQAAGA